MMTSGFTVRWGLHHKSTTPLKSSRWNDKSLIMSFKWTVNNNVDDNSAHLWDNGQIFGLHDHQSMLFKGNGAFILREHMILAIRIKQRFAHIQLKASHIFGIK